MLLKDNLAQIDLSIFSQSITTALEIYNFKKKNTVCKSYGSLQQKLKNKNLI